MHDPADRASSGGVVMPAIGVSAAIRDRIVNVLAAALPNEGCGVLGVVDGAVTSVYPVPNVANAPDRYTMDPAILVGALRTAEGLGEPIGALYHSHPDGDAFPSRTDRNTDVEHDWVHIIVGFAANNPVMAAFLFVDGSVVPVEIITPVVTRP